MSGVLFAAVLVAYFFFFYMPRDQDAKRNSTNFDQVAIDPYTHKFHNSLFIADLHADSLLWARDLKKGHGYGHVDIPRMLQGNLGLQVFSIVTKSPKDLNLFENDDRTDNIKLLSIAQRWPVYTWNSLYGRATYQSQKLHDLQAAVPSFRIIKYKEDLQQFIVDKQSRNKLAAGILSLEGGHALEGDLENVERLFDAGIRIIGFAHFFDNRLGGSAHGLKKGGITDFGLKVLKEMERLSILVDIAHASPALIDDIFTHTTRPVIATHTGVQAICNRSPRNLTDEQIKQIADSKGVVGIGFWTDAICSSQVKGIVDTIRYVTDLVGEDYVALGSDFDGNVQTPFDAAHIIVLTQALLDAGFTESQIKKVMGDNVRRLLLENLPARMH